MEIPIRAEKDLNETIIRIDNLRISLQDYIDICKDINSCTVEENVEREIWRKAMNGSYKKENANCHVIRFE